MATEFDWVAVGAVLGVYVVVFVVGVALGRRHTRRLQREQLSAEPAEVTVLAGRKIGGLLGVLTMTATSVGGGFLNGTAESVYRDGLIWTLAPLGIGLGLALGGLLFARPMREHKYLTMVDPFYRLYGPFVATLLSLVAIFADLCWTAAMLKALGTSLSIMVRLEPVMSICVSAGVAVLYTLIGEMAAVAWTDVVQLCFVIAGLSISVPYALYKMAGEDRPTRLQSANLTEPLDDLFGQSFSNSELLSNASNGWSSGRGLWRDGALGSLQTRDLLRWLDLLVAMTLGSIPWQAYFQRVLAMSSTQQARAFSLVSAVGVLVLAVPPALVGAAAPAHLSLDNSTGWSAVGWAPGSGCVGHVAPVVLPVVLREYCPYAVGVAALCALCTAVMSSVDSAALASASVLSYSVLRHVRASAGRESAGVARRPANWIFRLSLVLFGVGAVGLALFGSCSVYELFVLAADLVFVLLFPQLLAVCYFSKVVCRVGAVAGLLVGLAGRLLFGVEAVGLAPVITVWLEPVDGTQRFPFRCAVATLGFICMLAVSAVARRCGVGGGRWACAGPASDGYIEGDPDVAANWVYYEFEPRQRTFLEWSPGADVKSDQPSASKQAGADGTLSSLTASPAKWSVSVSSASSTSPSRQPDGAVRQLGLDTKQSGLFHSTRVPNGTGSRC